MFIATADLKDPRIPRMPGRSRAAVRGQAGRSGLAHAILIGALLASTIAASYGGETSTVGPKQLTREQAKSVLLVYLKSRGYKTESRRLDIQNGRDKADAPSFYMFEAYYDTATRLATIGFYAVNRTSAALWERVGCEEVKAKAIRATQAKLRGTLDLPLADREKNTSEKPCY
jgi:hypothetical protein